MTKFLFTLAAAVFLPFSLAGQGTFTEARAHYDDGRLEQAYALFVEAAREVPDDADRQAWLAETARRMRHYEVSAEAARVAIERSPCHAFAHTVLGFLFQPIYGGWERTNADSALHHLRRAVECDPTDGNAWIAVWVEALRRGERTWETRALESLVNTGFLPRTVLAYNRWVLGSLPDNAVLLTNGDWDTYPALGLQVAQGVREDVAVVNLSMLHLPWYARLVSERHGVPISLTVREMTALQGRPWALPDSVTLVWRRRSLTGELERPIAAAATVMQPRLAEGSGAFQSAGPFLLLRPDSAAPDTASIRRALSDVRAADFAGPEVSPADRSAVRVSAASGRPIASGVLLVALRYASSLLDAGRQRDAETMIEWSERYVRETSLGPEHRERVDSLRRMARRGG